METDPVSETLCLEYYIMDDVQKFCNSPPILNIYCFLRSLYLRMQLHLYVPLLFRNPQYKIPSACYLHRMEELQGLVCT
jgi:hypothetical protein